LGAWGIFSSVTCQITGEVHERMNERGSFFFLVGAKTSGCVVARTFFSSLSCQCALFNYLLVNQCLKPCQHTAGICLFRNRGLKACISSNSQGIQRARIRLLRSLAVVMGVPKWEMCPIAMLHFHKSCSGILLNHDTPYARN
jgi:hypothetical protein